MDKEMKAEFDSLRKEMNDRFDGVDEKLDDIENMMDHGFSQLLPKDQWPPSEHDLQQAEIRRKL